jgi:hypothetical protein
MDLQEADDMVAAYLERQKQNEKSGKVRFSKPEVQVLTPQEEMKKIETELKMIQGRAATVNNAAMAGAIPPREAQAEMMALQEAHRKYAERYVKLQEELAWAKEQAQADKEGTI